ncbi:MAG: radical SAM protein [Rhodospirillales bacterium]|nr:radical SAM protein [Rhodospirillales bacterium]
MQQYREPPDFGDKTFRVALVNITNACNLKCTHCFIYRDGNPNSTRDKMDDDTMLYQLKKLKEKHGIEFIYLMGGEPMIREKLVMKAAAIFDSCQVVTNGTYGLPELPGKLVTVSLDGPKEMNDPIRGDGVFDKVKEAVFARDPHDGTEIIVQMVLTAENQHGLEAFIEEVKDWPISGVALTFYVPTKDDDSYLAWEDLRNRDEVLHRVITLKQKYPDLIKANRGTLELMMSDVAIESTGENGEKCPLVGNTLNLYMGDGGEFENTFCCYGNDVDCGRCGTYLAFNAAYKQRCGEQKSPSKEKPKRLRIVG